jgi:hypothetical protein
LLVELISYVALAIAVVCGAVGTVSGIIGIVVLCSVERLACSVCLGE